MTHWPLQLNLLNHSHSTQPPLRVKLRRSRLPHYLHLHHRVDFPHGKFRVIRPPIQPRVAVGRMFGVVERPPGHLNNRMSRELELPAVLDA